MNFCLFKYVRVFESSGFALKLLMREFSSFSGPVNAPSLVGERGPELFVPKTAGTIITNQNLNNALNGKSTGPVGDTYLTQHVNFSVQGNTTRQTQSQIAAAVFSSGSKLAQRNN